MTTGERRYRTLLLWLRGGVDEYTWEVHGCTLRIFSYFLPAYLEPGEDIGIGARWSTAP